MNQPIPILFTIPNFITAGSGQAMLNVIQRLDRALYAPAVCVLRKGGRLDAEVERLGIPLLEAPFCIPARPYSTLMLRAWQAAQFLGPYRFALWHSYHYSSDYTEPIIARLSGAKGWIYTKKNMGWGERAWQLRSLLASRIAAQNTDMLDQFFSPPHLRRKTRLLPRGVDTQLFHPDTSPKLGLRQKLGISDQARVIACVAHLVPVKGHPTLLQAFAQLHDEPQIHLWLAGKPMDAEYTHRLQAQAQALGIAERVHFLGDVIQVPALLAESDIFCLTTWARWRMEGCPVAMLEAMACAKACVGTNIPGIRDQIKHDHNGLLVPPEDANALAAALQSLLDDQALLQRLGQAARQTVEREYTIEIEAQRHSQLYAELLENKQ